MAGSIDAKLKELGIEVPEPAAPVANYVPFVAVGKLVFISGQVPLVDGKPQYIGKVGTTFSVEEGQQAARICAMNLIAQMRAAAGGDLDKVKRVVRLGGFVNSTPDFTQQPSVVNGASDVMVEVFGDKGKHCRTAVSAGALPLDVAVEVDAVVELE
ncbi:RidA family protein [Algihabitans albus]|uniref:RidA family protein n=1 Tax=Algihabitans albus TaxID=2164067 RepID=UPI0035D0B773